MKAQIKQLKKNAYIAMIVAIIICLIVIMCAPIIVFACKIIDDEKDRLAEQLQISNELHIQATKLAIDSKVESLSELAVLAGNISEGQIFQKKTFSNVKLSEDNDSIVSSISDVKVTDNVFELLLDTLNKNLTNEIVTLTIANELGYYCIRTISSRNDDEIFGYIGDSTAYKTAMSGKICLADLTNLTINDKSIVSILIPIFYNDIVIGSLIATYDQSLFTNAIKHFNKTSESSSSVLFVSDGTQISYAGIDDEASFMSTAKKAFGTQKEMQSVVFKHGDTEYYAYRQVFKNNYLVDGAAWKLMTFSTSEKMQGYATKYTKAVEVIIAVVTVSLVACLVAFTSMLGHMRKEKDYETLKYRSAMESFKKLTFEYELESNLIIVSPELQKLFGISTSECDINLLIQRNYMTNEDANRIRALLPALKEQEMIAFDLFVPSNGRYFHIDMHYIRSTSVKNPFVMGILEDITSRILNQKELERKAQLDSLTGLLNREAMQRNIEKHLALNKNTRHALYLIDIDGFKQINDTYGHYIGDRLLQKMSQVIKSIFATENADVGRLGGDEFCVFLKDIYASKTIKDIAKTLTLRLSSIKIGDDVDNYIETSMGVAIYPKHGKTFVQLYQCADNALYHSKENAGSYYTIYDSLAYDSQSVKRNDDSSNIAPVEDNFSLMVNLDGEEGFERMKKILSKALENHEIKLYLQPKVSTRPNGITEAEALARWESSIYGMIMPSKFIPLFEQTKMIEQLDLYMLETVLSALCENKDDAVPTGINQSLQTITSPYYINHVAKLAEKYKLKKGLATIEITERGLFTSMRTITKVVNNLREIGFGISIDDFGSGFTTLSVLKDLDIDEIKIDKSFLDTGESLGSRSQIIISDVCNMAKRLGIKTVAEGVEYYEQVKYLCSMGCDQLQGFYFGKAMTIEEFKMRNKKGDFEIKWK